MGPSLNDIMVFGEEGGQRFCDDSTRALVKKQTDR